MDGSASWNTKRLMMAEIDNEADGGTSPSTLASALDSVRQGYVPRDDMDMTEVAEELESLVAARGGDALLEDFLTDKDWQKRAEDSLPDGIA